MSLTRTEISTWLQNHDRHWVVALGETTGWWTADDVDAVIAEQQTPAPTPRPDHYPEITPARPRQVHDRFGTNRGVVVEPIAAVVATALRREAAASVALDGETYALEAVTAAAHITVDVGEVVPDVVHPDPAPDQQEHPQVDDPAPTPPEVVHPHGRDLLAEGLAHRDPDVVAAARRAQRAVDQLATLLLAGGRR